MWWRIFVPTWGLFDVVPDDPRLFAGHDGRWEEVVPLFKRRWYSLLFNPEAAFFHATFNLLQRVIAHPQDQIGLTLVSQLLASTARAQGWKSFTGELRVRNEVVMRFEFAEGTF